jgi:serine/threonine-protein kinase HipA
MVFLHDVYVGKLCSEQASLSFTYDPQYLQQKDARPLSTSMPLGEETFSHSIVSAFFSGLLPDEGVRYRLAKYLQLSDKNIFSLLEAIGGECAGAVSVKISDQPISDAYHYLILSDDEALEVMRSLEQRPFLVGEDEIRISAAGAQCKLMISFVDGKMAIPKGHTPSTHIIKPTIPGYANTVENEYFCMNLAKKVGLKTPKVDILYLKNEAFYLVERYDRVVKQGQIQRLHQEDFCQILNIPPEVKYENEGGPSLKDCYSVIETFIRKGQMPGVDKLRLLQLVIFNFLIGNTDAHGKNFSILYLEKGMTLAPCYDLLSTMAYSNHFKDKMAMKIGGQYDNAFIQKKNWEKLAQDLGFKEAFLLEQLRKMAEHLPKEAASLMNGLAKSPIYPKILEVILHQANKIKAIF